MLQTSMPAFMSLLLLVDLGQIQEEVLAAHGTADLLEWLLKNQKVLDHFYTISGIVYVLGAEKKHRRRRCLKQ